jgi:hypothetical protein
MEAALSRLPIWRDSRRGGSFSQAAEIRGRLSAVARFYGNLIGLKYAEPFVVKEAMRVDNIIPMGVRSLRDLGPQSFQLDEGLLTDSI